MSVSYVVRPLNWKTLSSYTTVAATSFGSYHLALDAATAGAKVHLWLPDADVDTFEVFDNRRDAEAAAYEDYCQRIGVGVPLDKAGVADSDPRLITVKNVMSPSFILYPNEPYKVVSQTGSWYTVEDENGSNRRTIHKSFVAWDSAEAKATDAP